jgi:hypothetical protein
LGGPKGRGLGYNCLSKTGVIHSIVLTPKASARDYVIFAAVRVPHGNFGYEVDDPLVVTMGFLHALGVKSGTMRGYYIVVASLYKFVVASLYNLNA